MFGAPFPIDLEPSTSWNSMRLRKATSGSLHNVEGKIGSIGRPPPYLAARAIKSRLRRFNPQILDAKVRSADESL